MSSGARVVTAYAPATNKDEKPLAGWKILPNKTNGLTNTMTLTKSELVSDSRLERAGMVSSAEVSGDIDSEFMFGAFDDLMEGAFWNSWTGEKPKKLEIGETRKMFAISKDFKDINVNHIFTGCHVDTFSLSVNTDALIQVKFGFKGLGYEESKTESFAKTPTTLEDNRKASGLSIGTIKINNSPLGVCVESFELELNNQSEVQKCLGKGSYYGGNLLAMIANVTGKMTIAYSQAAHDILDNQRTGATISVEVPIEFSDEDKYIIKLPKVQISGDIPSPSGTELAKADVTFTVVDVSPVIEKYEGEE